MKWLFLFLIITIASARDYGQYADSPPEIRNWFRGLTDQYKNNCCDTSDGTRLEAPDWKFDGENYKVRLDGKWIDVPPGAVVTENNRVGYSIVWRIFNLDGTVKIRCFLPGPLG